MVISQSAIICLEATARPLRRALALLGRGRNEEGQAEPYPDPTPAPPERLPEPAAEASPAPLTADERRARAAALRGLLLARQRRFPAARSAFAEAVRLDPELDLAAVPTFCQLERGGHEAAVLAYEDAGRDHDAMALAARLREVYRPRLLPAARLASPRGR